MQRGRLIVGRTRTYKHASDTRVPGGSQRDCLCQIKNTLVPVEPPNIEDEYLLIPNPPRRAHLFPDSLPGDEGRRQYAARQDKMAIG